MAALNYNYCYIQYVNFVLFSEKKKYYFKFSDCNSHQNIYEYDNVLKLAECQTLRL
jgi:hypothetical protein